LPAPSARPLTSASLALARVPTGSVWHHIFLDRFPDPLGFGFAPSRFSDPRKNPARRFGVFYVGQSFEVAFLETIVRDRRNGNPGVLVLSADDLDAFVHVPVTVTAALNVVDLRGGNAVVLGVPTNTVRASSHRLGQRASLAVHHRQDQPDGIWYPSRLNGDDNLAVYDRAIGKLAAGPRRKLMQCPELAAVLDAYRAALV
jgi:RES domain